MVFWPIAPGKLLRAQLGVKLTHDVGLAWDSLSPLSEFQQFAPKHVPWSKLHSWSELVMDP